MKRVLMVLVLLASVALPSWASDIFTFSDGSTEAVAKLEAPGFIDFVNLTLPAECHVLNATMNVSTASGRPFAGPLAPRVLLDNATVWEFAGEGYGALGAQASFIDGNGEWRSSFPGGGGSNSTVVRLPAGATVSSATMEVECSGRVTGLGPVIDLKGRMGGDGFGISVSDAGDVNGDGMPDLIVGEDGYSDAGGAYIYFGGAGMNNSADVTLAGGAPGDRFGFSSAGAGDVNGDGFDDVVVGAFWNGTVGTVNGSAYIFLGGRSMDGIADVVLKGEANGDLFGCSVSGAGDLNGDGYNDIVVGAEHNSALGLRAGRAYLYFGGKEMDSTPDLVLDAEAADDNFGVSVSGAGDVDNDGFDDLIVGAWDAGKAYIYRGGAAMDNLSDVVLTGDHCYGGFGESVSGAGDVDGDGCDDVVVSAPWFALGRSLEGKAYLYLGGRDMDNVTDIDFAGGADSYFFGASVSGAGDVNSDGYDDLIIGEDCSDSYRSGRAYMYLGGPRMDGAPEEILNGRANGDGFGVRVSGAGDLNGDGRDEIVVGAHLYHNTGAAFVYALRTGLLDPIVEFAYWPVAVWSGVMNGTTPIPDFTWWIDHPIYGIPISGTDGYGISYIDIPVSVRASSEGELHVVNLSIVYNRSWPVPDFADELNAYVTAHKEERDGSGNISVHFRVESSSSGSLRLSDPELTLDLAPVPAGRIPDVTMDEDSIAREILDLSDYFIDDLDPSDQLVFAPVMTGGAGIVVATVADGRYLTLDASTGDLNDNWTGTVEMAVRACDRWGSGAVSNTFRVVVQNVPDEPVVTGVPPTEAAAGLLYVYQATAEDGDGDVLRFSLARGPLDMTISETMGVLYWTPAKRGLYEVSVGVSDGVFTVFQMFNISVPNQPPTIAPVPNATAHVGVPFSLDLTAADGDGDAPEFSLERDLEGMAIDGRSGSFSWTPTAAGNFTVRVKVGDGQGGEAVTVVRIQVLERVKPSIRITQPAEGSKVKGMFTAAGTAVNGTLPLAGVSVRIDSGMWFNATGTFSWNVTLDAYKLGNGKHALQARAFDGMEYSDTATRTFIVDNPKPGGKGFIPGFEALPLAVAAAALLVLRRKMK